MLDQIISDIKANIKLTLQKRKQLTAEMDALEPETYPQRPNFQWQDRGAENKYLYLTFRQTDTGGYGGPDGRRKIYIGNNPEKIERARQRAINTINYQRMSDALRRLDVFILSTEWEMEKMERDAKHILTQSTGYEDIHPEIFTWDSDGVQRWGDNLAERAGELAPKGRSVYPRGGFCKMRANT